MAKEFTKYPEIGRIYDHYKGGKYQVLTLAKHSENDETQVVYRSLHFGSVHTRPLRMWFEDVQNEDGKTVQRFLLSNEEQPAQPFFYSSQIIEKLKQVDQKFIDRDWTEDYEPRVLLREVMNCIRGIYTIE